MIESQIQENNRLDYHEFLTALSRLYSAVERVKKHFTAPANCTTFEKRRSFSIKFPILQLYPLFENFAEYRSTFPELSLHDVVLAWQTVFWLAEHHQLDSFFEYFFKAYGALKALYESFNK